MLGISFDGPDEVRRDLAIGESAGQQGLCKAANRSERGLEFMRNVRNEVSAHPFGSFDVRQVVKYDNGGIGLA